MYHVMQYARTGKIVEISQHWTLAEALAAARAAEDAWDYDLYGAAFVVHHSKVVSTVDDLGELDREYEAGYAYACGCRD